MRKLDFYKLTRPVQERFIGATKDAGAPAPLLVVPSRWAIPVGWLATAGLLALVLLVVMVAGYGSLDSSVALAPISHLVVYVVCLAGIALAVLRISALVAQRRELPFRAALYLFPVGVVDARSKKLRVFPLSELREVQALEASRRLRLDFAKGPSFKFPVAQHEQVGAVRETILQAQTRLREAEAAQDEHELAALDPLRDSGIPCPLMPDEPLQRKVPASSRFAIPLALAIGLAFGWSLWAVRNVLSEKRLVAAAKKENTVEAYRAYLAAGGEREEVSKRLLPMAQLRQARDVGSVQAIQRFIKENPKTHIQKEVKAALREALLSELEKAKQAGTVTALRELDKDSPYLGLIQQELQTATHAVYEQALKKFEKSAAPENQDLIPFMKRLLKFAEAKGPKVVVRFRLQPTPAGDRTDARVRGNPYYFGRTSLPSQYFEQGYARPRENKVGKAIVKRLQAAFHKDILEFSLGPAVPSGTGKLPKVKVPTLFIEHRSALTGTYLTDKPRCVLVGAGMSFKATFKIPKRRKSLIFKYSVWRRPDVNAVRKAQLPPKVVYERMASGGFERFQKKFLASIFKKP